MMKRRMVLLLSLFLLFTSQSLAFTPKEERQIIKDLTEIKTTLHLFMEQTNKRFEEIDKRFEMMFTYMNKRFEDMNKRFEDMNKRFEDMNKRFEDMNKRFEEINKRLEQLYTFLWIITGIFTSMLVAIIAFALWDRQTIVKRARDEALERIISVLRDLAREDQRVAEALRKHGFGLY